MWVREGTPDGHLHAMGYRFFRITIAVEGAGGGELSSCVCPLCMGMSHPSQVNVKCTPNDLKSQVMYTNLFMILLPAIKFVA